MPETADPIEINYVEYLPEITGLPIKTVVENLLDGKYEAKKENLIIRFIIHSDYQFSANIEFEKLKRVIFPQQNFTLAHEFAVCGYRFNITDLLALKDLKTREGYTIAHIMAIAYHDFSVDELLAIGNPANVDGFTVTHFMANHGHPFTASELLTLGNPALKDGFSVAHMQVTHGYVFTLPELITLGNPKGIHGWTVAHYMSREGHLFSPSEVEALGNPLDDDGKTIMEVWKAKSDNIPTIKSQRLIYHDGTPIFASSDGSSYKTGQTIVVAFGAWVGGTTYVLDNGFKLVITSNDSRWHVQVEDTDEFDHYNYLYRKALVSELAKKLNAAIQERRDFDFSEFEELFSNCCFAESYAEISVEG